MPARPTSIFGKVAATAGAFPAVLEAATLNGSNGVAVPEHRGQPITAASPSVPHATSTATGLTIS